MPDKAANPDKTDLNLFEELDYSESEKEDVVQAFFQDDESAVEKFVEPLKEGHRTELEQSLLSVFDDRYQELLSAYNAENDIEGNEIRERFVGSEKPESAMKYIEKFEGWTEEKLSDLIGNNSLVVQDREFGNSKYVQGVKGYSVRRLAEEKY